MGETTAEKMAREMKEVSVAEFFLKNKHFLGYENPTKSLVTVVKEAVDNSLTWNTPLLIRRDNRLELVKIGEMVDEQFKKYKKFKNIERNGNLEKLKNFSNIKILSFDPSSFKMKFEKIGTLFRHKLNSDIYRVTLENGRYIDITSYHSIFVLKDGLVTSLKTSELREGDFVIVPRKEWGIQTRNEIDILKELLKLPEEMTKDIGIYEIRKIIDEIKPEIKNILPKNKWYRLNDFKKCNRIPLNIVRKLPANFLKKFKKCKIGFMFSKHKILAKLAINEDLVKFLGIYAAEGSTLHNLHKIYLSFGIQEKDLIKYTKDLIKRLWKVKISEKKAHKTAKNLTINSKTLAFILKYIFKSGCRASEKRVPQLIFNLNKELKEKFFLSYSAGDGHPTSKIFKALENDGSIKDIGSEKITLATISKDLVVDLQYLLSSLGINYSYTETEGEARKINNIETYFSKSYVLYVYTNQEKSSINKLPVQEILEKTFDPKLKYSISRKNQKNVFFKTLERAVRNGGTKLKGKGNSFLNGDLGILRIKKIEKIKYDKEWVYDVSVPGNENFVAGFGPIFCHNSLDACEEAGILPEIFVSVKQVGENRFKIRVEDNGPGVIEQKVPPAFAKFLFGSKFHRLRQSRGIMGVGIHGAVLYSQLTTGKPVKVITSTGKEIHSFELMIDITKNEPDVISHKVEKNPDKWHGVKVEMEVEGRYVEKSQSILEYLKQTAIANPYAQIIYEGPNGKIEFSRVTSELPKPPKEIKPHPYGVELGILRKLLTTTKARNVISFLTTEFSRLGRRSAEQICRLAKIEFNKKPDSLNAEESERLHKAMQMVKLIAPPTDCLSPLDENLIREGLKKEIEAEYYVAIARPPTVYRGYPFQVSVGLAYGGNLQPNQACQLLRFANRVPLLYHQGDCVITEAVGEVDWRRYGLSQSQGQLPVGPLAILVHFASVWVPFTSEGKQAIASYPEILKEVKLALQDAGRSLAKYISQKRKLRERQIRRQIFERYLPEVANALGKLVKKDPNIILNKLEDMIKRKAEVKAVEGSKEKT